VAEIEVCGSVFDLGDDELLDRIEADRATGLLNLEACQGRAALPKQQRGPVVKRRMRRRYRAALVEIYSRRFRDGGRRGQIDDCFRAL
jgi:hypothetical protein